MTGKHTAGPWRVGDAGHTVFGPPMGEPAPMMVAQRVRPADARLIAAAPELLEAVRGAVLVVQDATFAGPLGQAYRDLAERMRAAIRKAEGESHV